MILVDTIVVIIGILMGDALAELIFPNQPW